MAGLGLGAERKENVNSHGQKSLGDRYRTLSSRKRIEDQGEAKIDDKRPKPLLEEG